jgi:hypothetical protein
VDITDQLAGLIMPEEPDASRFLLQESVAAAYREGRLTMEQVREALGLPTRMHVDTFLQAHGVFDYTSDDLERDLAALDRNVGVRLMDRYGEVKLDQVTPIDGETFFAFLREREEQLAMHSAR